MLQLVGAIVDHTLPSKPGNKLSQEIASLWNAEYPDDPFEVDIRLDAPVNPKYVDGRTDFSYDIIAAADRQKEFYYQVMYSN